MADQLGGLTSSVVEYVIRIFILDTILSFCISYYAKLALDNLRILAERSLIIVLIIKLYYKLRVVHNLHNRLV
jgi:hypothetical protein